MPVSNCLGEYPAILASAATPNLPPLMVPLEDYPREIRPCSRRQMHSRHSTFRITAIFYTCRELLEWISQPVRSFHYTTLRIT
jgi:hypothetical protein